MTEQELNRVISENDVDISNAMYSNCNDHHCDCHYHVPKLVEHIRHLESIIGDRMEESDFLLKAGAAEERARVCVIIRSEPFAHKTLDLNQDKVSLRQVSELLAAWPSSLPELLPPSHARLEAERLREENEKLQKKMRALEPFWSAVVGPGGIAAFTGVPLAGYNVTVNNPSTIPVVVSLSEPMGRR